MVPLKDEVELQQKQQEKFLSDLIFNNNIYNGIKNIWIFSLNLDVLP